MDGSQQNPVDGTLIVDTPGNGPADHPTASQPSTGLQSLHTPSGHHLTEATRQAGTSGEESLGQNIALPESPSSNITSPSEITPPRHDFTSSEKGMQEFISGHFEVLKKSRKEELKEVIDAQAENIEKLFNKPLETLDERQKERFQGVINAVQEFINDRLQDLKKNGKEELEGLVENVQVFINGCLEVLKKSRKEELKEVIDAQTENIEKLFNKPLKILDKKQQDGFQKVIDVQAENIQTLVVKPLETLDKKQQDGFRKVIDTLETLGIRRQSVPNALTNDIRDFVNERLENFKSHHDENLKEVIIAATKDLAPRYPEDPILDLFPLAKDKGATPNKEKTMIQKTSYVFSKIFDSINSVAQSYQSNLFGLFMMMAHSTSVGTAPRWIVEKPQATTEKYPTLSRAMCLNALISSGILLSVVIGIHVVFRLLVLFWFWLWSKWNKRQPEHFPENGISELAGHH